MNLKLLITLPLVWLSLSADTAVLSKIVDGDTAHFADGKKVRFANIDTPESSKNKKGAKDANECGVSIDEIINAGKLSSQYTKQLLAPGTVYRLECDQSDQYGRSICEIYKGDMNINLSLVENGYAVPFEKYIHSHEALLQYRNAVKKAKNGNLGLWSKSNRVIECMRVKEEKYQ